VQRKWLCTNIKTNKAEVSDKEIKQRLAEVVVLLFNQKSQLSRPVSPIQEINRTFVLQAPQSKRSA